MESELGRQESTYTEVKVEVQRFSCGPSLPTLSAPVWRTKTQDSENHLSDKYMFFKFKK